MARSGDVVILTTVVAAGAVAYLLARHYAGAIRSTKYRDLFESVAKKYGHDADLLQAIAAKENPAQDPLAVGAVNTNGTRDYGLMQVNEKTGAQYGYTIADLKVPANNVNAAGMLLRDNKKALGTKASVWTLVSSYNAGASRVLQSGIINWPYVNAVLSNLNLIKLGRA